MEWKKEIRLVVHLIVSGENWIEIYDELEQS